MVALILCAALGVGAYLYFSNNKPAPAAPPAEQTAATEQKTEPQPGNPARNSGETTGGSHPQTSLASKPDPAPWKPADIPPDGSDPSTTLAKNDTPKPALDPSLNAPGSTTGPTPAASSFDLTGFLDRARKIMAEKAQPFFEARSKSLATNLDAYDRKIKRSVRRLDNNRRGSAEASAELVIDKFRAKGNRLTPVIYEIDKLGGKDMDSLREEIKGIHAEYRAKQDAIDGKLTADLATLASTYIGGLELHASKLTAAGDPTAANALQAEADATRGHMIRFKNLMLGRGPNDADPDADEPAPAPPAPPADPKKK